MFDACIANAHRTYGHGFSSSGRMNMRNAKYTHDFGPLDSSVLMSYLQESQSSVYSSLGKTERDARSDLAFDT